MLIGLIVYLRASALVEREPRRRFFVRW